MVLMLQGQIGWNGDVYGRGMKGRGGHKREKRYLREEEMRKREEEKRKREVEGNMKSRRNGKQGV